MDYLRSELEEGMSEKGNVVDPSLEATSSKLLPGELKFERINANKMLCDVEQSK